MKTFEYRFRAECKDDANRFFMNIDTPIKACLVDESKEFPDVEYSLISFETLEKLKQIADKLDDLHVIKETINYTEDYTGVRTYE